MEKFLYLQWICIFLTPLFYEFNKTFYFITIGQFLESPKSYADRCLSSTATFLYHVESLTYIGNATLLNTDSRSKCVCGLRSKMSLTSLLWSIRVAHYESLIYFALPPRLEKCCWCQGHKPNRLGMPQEEQKFQIKSAVKYCIQSFRNMTRSLKSNELIIMMWSRSNWH